MPLKGRDTLSGAHSVKNGFAILLNKGSALKGKQLLLFPERFLTQ